MVEHHPYFDSKRKKVMQYTLIVLVVLAKNVAALCDAPSKVTGNIQPLSFTTGFWEWPGVQSCRPLVNLQLQTGCSVSITDLQWQNDSHN